jgi:hypothetical protein
MTQFYPPPILTAKPLEDKGKAIPVTGREGP